MNKLEERARSTNLDRPEGVSRAEMRVIQRRVDFRELMNTRNHAHRPYDPPTAMIKLNRYQPQIRETSIVFTGPMLASLGQNLHSNTLDDEALASAEEKRRIDIQEKQLKLAKEAAFRLERARTN